MTAETQIPTATPAEPADSGPQPESQTPGRANGKVARLPKSIRDQINHWLLDGISYPDIIKRLGEPGQDLKPDHISQWKKRGHQQWLKDEFWREEMRARMDTFTGLLGGADPVALPEGGLQVAALGLCGLLRDLCQLGQNEKGEPGEYVRVANSLSRLSRSILQLQQYRDNCSKAKAVELKRVDPNREFNERERDGWMDRADDLFGFKSAARLKRSAKEEVREEREKARGARGEVRSEKENGSVVPAVQPTTPEKQPGPEPSAGEPPSTADYRPSPAAEHCLQCSAPLPPPAPDG